jgi:hypothetical protein
MSSATQKASEYIRDFPERPDPPEDLEGWLSKIHAYVEGEAKDAVDWYIRNTRYKRHGSYIFRYLAIVLGGIAGLLPIVWGVLPAAAQQFSKLQGEQVSLLVSLLLGLAAVLVGLDRFSDCSAGWMRYMLTAFNIRKELQSFRLEWACLYSERPQPLTREHACKALELAKTFVLAIEQHVGEETRQWATEFQQNLAAMEKEVAAKWEAREKEAQQQREAAKPGALQLTVTNAKQTDGRAFTVSLQPGGVQESVSGAQTWVRAGLTPGMYTVTVRATIGGQQAGDSKVFQVESNRVTEGDLTLLD